MTYICRSQRAVRPYFIYDNSKNNSENNANSIVLLVVKTKELDIKTFQI